MNSREVGYPDAPCAREWYIFKFVMLLFKSVETDLNFYMEKEFCKNIDFLLLI